jgi:uncharacterized protein YcbK (DUF882 family)
VPVGKARLKACGLFAARAGYSCGFAVLVLLFASRGLQNAVAEGDTRTISMHHMHTGEDITITYKRDGVYDDAALEKLNWFLRDWRRAQETKMDPHLVDLVWEVQRETGSSEPIQVVCGYRSPETNAMLRHRSQGVARFSQHMLGKAMDFYIPGVPLAELRAIGLRLQRGGVGFYPTSGSPFVHMDTGGIRMWPRMTREELVKVFPDGRTVHIPTDGRPLSGYALALADIRKRGSSDPSENSLDAARKAGVDVGSVVAANQPTVNPFAKLFGLAKREQDEDDDATDSDTAAAAPGPAKAKPVVLAKLEHAAAKTVAAARAGVAETPKLIRAAATVTRAEAAQNLTAASLDQTTQRYAGLTPNQVISDRGYWHGAPDGTRATLPAATSAPVQSATSRPQGTEVASAGPLANVATGPWSNAAEDRVPPELALAYAEQPGRAAPFQATPIVSATLAATSASDSASNLIAERGMTIAAKGLVDHPQAALQKATRLASATVKVTNQLDDPWLRAVVVSPSVYQFLTTLALGVRDLTTLAALMVKPESSVMMTFSSDPNLGLTHDHFSGSAIVFISTVNYPTHTASLQ